MDKYKNISKASEQKLAALEQKNKELLASVASSPRGYSEYCFTAHHIYSVMYGTPWREMWNVISATFKTLSCVVDCSLDIFPLCSLFKPPSFIVALLTVFSIAAKSEKDGELSEGELIRRCEVLDVNVDLLVSMKSVR